MSDENKSTPETTSSTYSPEALEVRSVASRQLVADMLEFAKAHYGDNYEDDGQFLFGLACDVVRAAAYEYEGENGPLEDIDGTPTADVLSSVLANVCPGYVCTDDENWRSDEATVSWVPPNRRPA